MLTQQDSFFCLCKQSVQFKHFQLCFHSYFLSLSKITEKSFIREKLGEIRHICLILCLIKEMGCRRILWFYLAVIVFSTILLAPALALTNPLDVAAIQDLYKSLNSPQQLKGWKSDSGDPCGESWTGVSCFESSMLYINLSGLDLTGSLGGQLFNLYNLKQLDVSSNNIQGEIPYGLPPNATHINLACNNLSQNIPPTLTSLSNLRHLNLSHNSLSGSIGNVFTGLHYLKEMDLSYNKFTGDLPTSFKSLTNLTGLFLQNNTFTGAVIFLAELPLIDLNIQDNQFSCIIPEKFQSIPNLRIGGNKFQIGGNYPPWNFPLVNVPKEQNISSPPTTESSAIENYPSLEVGGQKKKRLGLGGIAILVCGGTLVVGCAVLIFAIHIKRSRAEKHKSMESSESSLHSPTMSSARDYSSSIALEESPQILSLTPPPVMTRRGKPPALHIRTQKFPMRSFSQGCRVPENVKIYSVAELHSATNSFSEENYLGEGSLGCVYKAVFPDGQIMAVKNINTVALSLHEEEQFLDVIWNASRLKHRNIVRLLGYCVEHGQHLLVYEYVGNFSLDDALHCEAYKPLSWGLRLHIALGIARALEYLHSTFSPPVTHNNLKATNILLDAELMPRVCDCGLTVLRPLSSNSVKLKASEMAIGGAAYIAPEHGQTKTDNTKSDIYAFGVLLLELLTGRRPFDSSRPMEEQSLVEWALSRLHDSEYLDWMVDSSIQRTLCSRTLSCFADIISLCLQPEKAFRPPMSEIVESLTSLIQKATKEKSISADGTDLEKSFRSTNTRFMGSPTMSYFSI